MRSSQTDELASPTRPSHRTELLFVAGPLVIGMYLAVSTGRSAFLFGDEFHSLRNLPLSYRELISTYDSYGTGVPLPILQKAALGLFGPSLAAIRWPAFAGALGALLISYPVAKRLVGREAAAIAALALATNGMHVFYSHFARVYSLVIFFSLLMIWAMLRALDDEKPRLWWYLLFAIAGGVTPWFHLSSAAFVAGAAVAGIAYVVATGRPRSHAGYLLAASCLAPAICTALYLPSLNALWNFVNAKAGYGQTETFSALDILGLLAGSPELGVAWAFALPAGFVWFAIRDWRRAILLGTAILAPVLGMAVMRPDGMAHAYARYLLPALPFALMLIAWFVVQVVQTFFRDRTRARRAAWIAGTVLIVLGFAAGPLGVRRVDDGPFANTYLSMMPLPAFTPAWPGSPKIYSEIGEAAGETIVEIPELVSRSALLYRNYFLQHHQPVKVGSLLLEGDVIPAKSYVAGNDVSAMRDAGARYAIVHYNLEEELPQYFQFVFDEVWAQEPESQLASYMEQHRIYRQQRIDVEPAIEALTAACGAPVFEDRFVKVWRLDHSSDG